MANILWYYNELSAEAKAKNAYKKGIMIMHKVE